MRKADLCDVVTTPFEFEGGNLLFSADHLFVGADADRLSAFTAELAGFAPLPRKTVLIDSQQPVPAEITYASSLDNEPWHEVFYFRNRQGTRQPLFTSIYS